MAKPKTPKKPVKKVVTNRKTGKVTVGKTPIRRMTMVEKTKGAMSPLQKLAVKGVNSSAKIIKKSKPVKKVLTPEQKSKLLALKKREEIKRPREKIISNKKKLSPGERERASRVSRKLAVKARIKRNSGN